MARMDRLTAHGYFTRAASDPCQPVAAEGRTIRTWTSSSCGGNRGIMKVRKQSSSCRAGSDELFHTSGGAQELFFLVMSRKQASISAASLHVDVGKETGA